MGEFIHWPKSYLLLSITCEEILSWMIEFGMKHHLVCQKIKIRRIAKKNGNNFVNFEAKGGPNILPMSRVCHNHSL
jgi:hypothetical protein